MVHKLVSFIVLFSIFFEYKLCSKKSDHNFLMPNCSEYNSTECKFCGPGTFFDFCNYKLNIAQNRKTKYLLNFRII